MRDFNVCLEVDGRQVMRPVKDGNRFDAATLAQSALEKENPLSKVEVVSIQEVGGPPVPGRGRGRSRNR